MTPPNADPRSLDPEPSGGGAARIRWATDDGSVFEAVLDDAGMRWRRLVQPEGSPMRSESGRLLDWPYVEVGQRSAFISEPIGLERNRVIVTSRVTAILEIDGPQPIPVPWSSHERT